MTTKLYIPVSELKPGDKIGIFKAARRRDHPGGLLIGWVFETFSDEVMLGECDIQKLIYAFGGVDREVEYEEVARVTIKRAHRTHAQWLVDGVNSDHWWKENVQYGDILTLQRPKV